MTSRLRPNWEEVLADEVALEAVVGEEAIEVASDLVSRRETIQIIPS